MKNKVSQLGRQIVQGAKQCGYTMIHPVNGFDQVKWERKGSIPFSFVILACFVLVNVFDQVLTGFAFNGYNPDQISVPSIFLICISGFLICYAANWAVSSLMFTEGEPHNIFIVLCYCLVPYIVCELLYITASNFTSQDLAAFLIAIRVIGIAWSGVILVVGMFYIHQMSFGKLMVNLLLSVVGVLAILLIILLIWNLVEQIYTFIVTIVNEMIFRL